VSEQRAAQQARLAAAIAQREMLVKEVHHRIKNNLQGVAGLRQQTAAQRPEVADILDEVVGQVQAIAEACGLRVGAAGPLPLRQLVDSIAAAIQRLLGHRIVLADPTASPHDWALPEAEAIPLALTINELLTNAVKHSQALAAGEREPVACNLGSSAQAVRLSIANRARLPEGFSLAGRAAGITGLALVQSLLPPRSATLRIEQEGEWVVASLLLVAPGIVQIPAAAAPLPESRATPW
jgi:two-component sensor histidine kinase